MIKQYQGTCARRDSSGRLSLTKGDRYEVTGDRFNDAGDYQFAVLDNNLNRRWVDALDFEGE